MDIKTLEKKDMDEDWEKHSKYFIDKKGKDLFYEGYMLGYGKGIVNGTHNTTEAFFDKA